MFRSLHMKLTLILLLLITSLMAVVGAFLTTSISSFYIDSFYQQISDVFSDDSDGYVSTLRARAAEPDGAAGLRSCWRCGPAPLASTTAPGTTSSWTDRPAAISTGRPTHPSFPGNRRPICSPPATPSSRETRPWWETAATSPADYMDAAIPIMGGDSAYIIYILDNKATVTDLNSQIFLIIMQALIIGLLISVLLSFLLSKTMVGPIEKLTAGAERVAAGDFDSRLPVESTDEIGILTGTFNEMAGVLQVTLAAVENERNKLDTLFLHMTDGVVAFEPRRIADPLQSRRDQHAPAQRAGGHHLRCPLRAGVSLSGDAGPPAAQLCRGGDGGGRPDAGAVPGPLLRSGQRRRAGGAP